MTDNEPTAETEGETGFLRKHRGSLATATAFALLCLASTGAYFWHQANLAPPPEAVPAPKLTAVALVDLKQVMAAHASYAKLEELEAERQILSEELADLLTPMLQAPPEVDKKPFDDSVWQKNAQNILSQVAEIERLQKQAAAKYREEHQHEYEARRDELRGKYQNAALNLQLKLQNADNLGLSEETVSELARQLDALRQERNANQYVLLQAWEAEVAAYAQSAVAERRQELRKEMESSTAALRAEALKKQTEAQARDAAAMEEQMTASRQKQEDLYRKREELAAKELERDSLEARILNDIAGRAAKLAIMRHFTMVIADPATNPAALIPWDKWQGAKPVRYQQVVGIDTVDITAEMIQEIQSLSG